MTAASRRILMGTLAAGALLLPLLWLRTGGDAMPAPSHAWEDAVAALERDPAQMMAFLAERARTRDGQWDYRWMTPPARTLWATLRCERGLIGSGGENPTAGEAAEAFAELGLGELAAATRRLDGGGAGAWVAWRAAHAATQTRLAAARRDFALAHRRAIERPQ